MKNVLGKLVYWPLTDERFEYGVIVDWEPGQKFVVLSFLTGNREDWDAFSHWYLVV